MLFAAIGPSPSVGFLGFFRFDERLFHETLPRCLESLRILTGFLALLLSTFEFRVPFYSIVLFGGF